MRAMVARFRTVVLLSSALTLASCGAIDRGYGSLVGQSTPVGQPGHVTGFLGGVVADEPHAVLTGRQVLSAGGNAADAAVAMGLTLAVTLPSRAGLGGGGGCLAFAAGRKPADGPTPEAILFVPGAPSSAAQNADRPAALPMLARGMFLLHARYGSQPFDGLVSPAEQLARFGVPVSKALARDLSAVAEPLFADPAARSVFSHNGVPLREGETLQQPALGATLAQLRVAGVGDLYQGALAHRLAGVSAAIGGPLTVDDLRQALPQLTAPLTVSWHDDKAAFLPPPADGGLAAAAAFQSLVANPSDLGGASARALAVAARWRQGGATPEQVLAAPNLPAVGMPMLPASTSYAVVDRDGNAVVCALSMNNLFGTGRLFPGLGFFAGASPRSVPAPLLAAGMVYNFHLRAFRAEVGGSGQAGAPMAVAVGLLNALNTGRPMPAPVPEPGRANVIVCNQYLPDASASCGWAADPREAGLAAGGG